MSISDIPVEILPEGWKDEARLNVMYAPYRPTRLNPKDWEVKCDFWKKTIYVYVKHQKNYVCYLEMLSKAFFHKGRSPNCLEMVMQDMYDKGELLTVHEFKQKLKPSTSWSGWTADWLVRKPMAWGFNMMKQYMIRLSVIDEGVFVHLKAIEENARELLKNIPDNLRNKVINFRELDEVFNGHDSENARLVLHFLECIGEVSVKEIEKRDEVNNVVLVKVGNIRNTNGISETEVNAYMLGKTEKILLDTIEKLEIEKDTLIKDAKGHVLKGHKQLAKTCLRKKHDIERRIESRANALYNVQTLLSHVEDAAHNAHILDTYKFALDSLRNNFKDNKLSEESVTNTMIEIGDVLDIHNDIQTALIQPLSDSDCDLEAELEQLLAEDADDEVRPGKPRNISPNPKKEELDVLSDEISKMNLPDVPVDSPNTSAFEMVDI